MIWTGNTYYLKQTSGVNSYYQRVFISVDLCKPLISNNNIGRVTLHWLLLKKIQVRKAHSANVLNFWFKQSGDRLNNSGNLKDQNNYYDT